MAQQIRHRTTQNSPERSSLHHRTISNQPLRNLQPRTRRTNHKQRLPRLVETANRAHHGRIVPVHTIDERSPLRESVSYIGILRHRYYDLPMGSASSSTATVKVSKNTLRELEHLRDVMKLKSINEALVILIRERRRRALAELFGIDKGRIHPFTHEDRDEDR